MSSIRTLSRRVAWSAVAAIAALTLAACGGDGDGDGAGHGTASPSTGATASAGTGATASAGTGATSSADDGTATAAHNAQDVSFAQGMIPHHRQALEMARLADGRAASADVKDLAARIEKAQAPEIATLTGWLKSWGEQVPEPAESMSGMDHSGHSGMPGMMDGSDMEELEAASGKAFDTAFLRLMIEHHKGAVEMAATEREKGAYGPAKALAAEIVSTQKDEIAEMNRLLGRS